MPVSAEDVVEPKNSTRWEVRVPHQTVSSQWTGGLAFGVFLKLITQLDTYPYKPYEVLLSISTLIPRVQSIPAGKDH